MKTKHDIDSETLAMALLKAVVRARRARNLAVLGVLSISLTACGAHVQLPTSEGRILIDADAKGMQAFFDGQNGMITNGKASPDQDTAHWRTRRAEMVEVTKREYAPSLLDKLTGSTTTAPVTETSK